MQIKPVWFKRVQIASFGSAFIALIVWQRFETAWPLTAALFAASPGFFAASLESLLSKRVRILEWIVRQARTWHLVANLWGFTFMLLAILCLYGAGIRVFNLSPELHRYLSEYPGLALLPSGLIIGSTGLAVLIGPVEWWAGWKQFILRLPARALGLLLIFTGLAAIALGFFELVAPARFDQWTFSTLGPLNPFP